MPSDPNFSDAVRERRAASPPIPSFSMLQRGSMLRRMKSNFADCITASPKGVPPWEFAAMFRSAQWPKGFPTRPLLESVFLHVCALTVLLSAPPARSTKPALNEIDAARAENRIIYYRPADRLPAVSPAEPSRAEAPRTSQSPPIRIARSAVERVISRPPRPDNARQTIVQPEAPDLQLPTDVAVPNIVAWRTPVPPRPSVTEAQRQLARIRVPRLAAPVIEAPTPPPPELSLPEVSLPSPPVARLPEAPLPPRPSVADMRREIARMGVPRLAAPAVEAPIPVPPKLSLPEITTPQAPVGRLPAVPVPPSPSLSEAQRQVAELRTPRMPAPSVERPAVVLPAPPEVALSAEVSSLPSLVTVGVAPAPPPVPVAIRIPPGNRSGEFAISPDGESSLSRSGQPGRREHPGAAPALPNLGAVADIRVPNLSIAGDRSALPAPPAPVVSVRSLEARGEAVRSLPAAPQGDLQSLMARATRPSLIPEMTRGRGVETEPGAFGNRRVYTVYINMPNLASGAGSWILRFAERDADGATEEEISSPVAVKKVDPKYAPEAVRERVEGTVTLAAQILRNGAVTAVKVVHGLDPRLDLSAVQALTLWQFEPARKKGIPIDLEVLVQIPFRLPAF